MSARASDGHVLRRIVEEHSEATPDTLHTGFVFTLPPDATPSFEAPSVALRWALQFEFHVAAAGAGLGGQQVLKWGIPISVWPPSEADAAC